MHVTSKTLNLQFGVGIGGIIVGGGRGGDELRLPY